MRRQVTLYGKAGCHLCEEAKSMLLRLQREVAFDLREIDILSDPALESLYRHDIPAVVIDDSLQLTAPLYEREVRAALG